MEIDVFFFCFTFLRMVKYSTEVEQHYGLQGNPTMYNNNRNCIAHVRSSTDRLSELAVFVELPERK